jgi:hypothetical protein
MLQVFPMNASLTEKSPTLTPSPSAPSPLPSPPLGAGERVSEGRERGRTGPACRPSHALLSKRRACDCAMVVALLCAGLCLAMGADAASFIPRNSTVVLCAGLPGDVESENSYREQLRAWLAFLEHSTVTEKIVVLWDDAESITPGNTPLQIVSANRTNFLALTRSAGGGTNSLVFVVWGHGGRQGNTPVFHVRGPRLTPLDFKNVADQAGGESRWILMFRGSGHFARELAGANRQILASEHDTMFNSDPVGMQLLLKITRAKPAISLVPLAEELGRATSAWYAERNLARTEEPTLWLESESPRLLAARERDSLASVPPESSPRDPHDDVEKPKAPDSRVSSALPPSWKNITRANAQDFPDADAVTLRRKISYTLGASPAVSADHEEFIQILTAEGKRFGDFDISFSPPQEDITFSECEVLGPDGTLTPLDPDSIREAREESVGDYSQPRRKFFSLPGVVPGAILHVRYRTEWKKFPLPHVSLEVPIGAETPALESEIEVSLPREWPFHFAFDHVAAPDPAIRQSEYGATYLWTFRNLRANEDEILSVPRRHARLLLSTFPDWTAFRDWYARLCKLADDITPEISAKAKELTRDAETERDKVAAVYNYVTSLRYVAVPLGVNSLRPHAAANVLHNQFGDCKDKANLFNTLLRSMDIEAHLVLVPRFSQAHPEIPGLAFNHAISRVTLGDEIIWADTTDDVCRFGMLPPGDPGRNVLVIDEHSTGVTALPFGELNEHLLRVRATLDGSRPAEGLAVAIRVNAAGFPDYELRSAASEAKNRNTTLPLLAARFRPASGVFALEEQRSTPVSALESDFSWDAEGTHFGAMAESDGTWRLHAPFWLPRQWDLALNRRSTALFLNQGYPLVLDQELEFVLPNGAKPGALPGVKENNEPPLRWKTEWLNAGEDTRLRARLRVELVRGELTLDETSAFQKQLRELLTALAAGATVAMPP